MALKDVLVPDIGDYSKVDVIEVNVKVGDQVKAEDPLITLETDKATMEVPAPFAGTVKEIKVKAGDKVSEGDLVLKVEAEGDDSTEKESSKAEEKPVEKPEEKEEKPSAAPEAKPDTQEKTSSSGASQEITVPDIGDYSNVDVIEVNVKVGDTVEKEQPLITLETDKATMEVPSPVAGKIIELTIKEGGKVSKGDVIGKVESGEAAPAEQKPTEAAPAEKSEAKPAEAAAKPESKPEPASAEPVATDSDLYASPSVRRIAREFGIDLAKITASGRKGRLTKEDVQNYVKSVMQSSGTGGGGVGMNLLPDPVIDFGKFGEIEAQPLARITKISGANLHRNWVKIPHITLFEDADITDLEAFRTAKKAAAEKVGVKLTPVPFIVKAIAKALTEFPNVNSSLAPDGENQILKKYVHVGVAVDTPNGLMVPVIRDADKKGVYDIARDLMDYAAKARDGKLKPTDMQGGCFTISSLGGIGTTAFTPIVNMPEVAILGVSKAAMKPIFDGVNGFKPRLMLPLSLSVDHRVVDGAEAGKFVVTVARYLADLRELLL